MTFTQSWPSDYKSQVAYINSLLDFVQDQDAGSATIGLAQTTLPVTNELQAAWQNYIGDSRPIPPGARLQWWDTSRSVLDTVFSTTKDVGIDGSTGNLYEVSPKRRTLDMGVIAADALQVSASVVVSLESASALWKHMWSSAQFRYSAAAAQGGGARYQATTGIYFSERIQIQGGVAGRSGLDFPALTLFPNYTTPGNTDVAYDTCYHTIFYPYPFGTLRDKVAIGIGTHLFQTTALPIVSGSRFIQISVGFLQQQAAATQWGLGNAGSPLLDPGANYVLWGLK